MTLDPQSPPQPTQPRPPRLVGQRNYVLPDQIRAGGDVDCPASQHPNQNGDTHESVVQSGEAHPAVAG